MRVGRCAALPYIDRMKSAFDKIAAGLEDAIAFAAGDEARGRVATVDVRAVRAATKLTQGAFARTYRSPVGTVRDWEQRRRHPDTGSATLLKMIEVDPKGLSRLLRRFGDGGMALDHRSRGTKASSSTAR